MNTLTLLPPGLDSSTLKLLSPALNGTIFVFHLTTSCVSNTRDSTLPPLTGLLMKASFAPEFLSVEEIYGWYMITMRDLSSNHEAYYTIDIKGWDRHPKAKAQAAVALGVNPPTRLWLRRYT